MRNTTQVFPEYNIRRGMKDYLVVNEIFFSIQGESSYAGKPCTFVRLTFCNLRCTYCDTEYAFYNGQEMSIQEVLDKIRNHPTDLVEITGGEPLLQPAVFPLITRLLNEQKTVLIETGGGVDIRSVDRRAVLIYDIKCPDSGMVDKNRWEDISYLKPEDEVKFVLASNRDYEWAKAKIDELKLPGKHSILFSPVWGQLEAQELAAWVLRDGLPIRLQLQLHKVLWGAEKRGV